jgi:tRNA (guanine37-N1)-methyltransferase
MCRVLTSLKRESDCNFTFDFSEVYWNSRLQYEHGRLIGSFAAEDVVADVFAGIGPFALPAAKKGCGVLANDLNPSSFKYLVQNMNDNDVGDIDGSVYVRLKIF